MFAGSFAAGRGEICQRPCAAVADAILAASAALPARPAEVNSATGQAASGEVEDYVLMSLGNQLWYDNGGGNPTNTYDGLFDSGEATVRRA